MGKYKYVPGSGIQKLLIYTFLLLCLSACGGLPGISQPQANQNPTATPSTISPTDTVEMPTAQPTQNDTPVLIPSHIITPTAGKTTHKPTKPQTPKIGNPPGVQPAPTGNGNGNARPVLAFYYMWYNPSTWSANTMSDLPANRYTSSSDALIDQQVNEASGAGITGFISSWWGAGDKTDKNFVKLLAHSAALENRTHYHFASSIYFECDAPAFNGPGNIASGLQYLTAHYGNDAHFFHWQGKPVFFFWDPLGQGRTLAEWAAIRSQVDPGRQTIWSAEGVDTALLSVFDGIHLFSGGYWGLQSNTMTTVDQGFRAKIDAYDKANGTQKIWAAGIIPGYDDTHVPGRVGAYIVPRNNGSTYSTSWASAIASKPDWITITSFNEWFEGSMIEPSATYGNEYLNITQQFAQQWHG